MTPGDFLANAVKAAKSAGHCWPGYAVCEAAEESAWASSKLAIQANNLFGQKWPQDPPAEWPYKALQMPTHEWDASKGQMVPAESLWPIFGDWETCFRERMNLLRRLSAYRPALEATTGEGFVIAVSKVWATDPKRADNVLAIHTQYESEIQGLLMTA